MDKNLQEYVNGQLEYSSLFGILISDMKNQWHSKIGYYIWQTLDKDEVEDWALGSPIYYSDSDEDFFKSNSRTLASISIMFLTSILNHNSLTKIFGSPIYHNQFGEGFDTDFEMTSKEYISCASYLHTPSLRSLS